MDIFATDADTGKKIIIENQLEDTEHDHLGKLITYASGKSVDLVIWVVRKARPEHRAAIEWLNNHTDEGVGFILCEIKVFRIGNSEPAPKFEIIEQPNNWVKEMKKTTGSIERTVLPKIKDMLKWGVVKVGDFTFSCALLTAILRENHFCNGVIQERYEKGQITSVLNRMIKTFGVK